jgi:hypothetical protein
MLIELVDHVPFGALAEIQEWLTMNQGRLRAERVYSFHNLGRIRYTVEELVGSDFDEFIREFREWIAA